MSAFDVGVWANRVGVDDGLYRGYGARAQAYRGHKADLRTRLALYQALIGDKKERAVLLDGASQRAAKLVQSQRRNRGAIKRRTGVRGAVTKVFEDAAVQLIAAGLRNHFDLPGGSTTVFSRVQGGVHAEFGYGVGRNHQPALLRLVTNRSSVDAVDSVDSEVVVVRTVAQKPYVGPARIEGSRH
jgi:hypothetical protein